ncbi:uncharacterized protein LOC121253410 [Juglans microcarpa x Juglans regia]|uniref:uncharacterized protein LOC121253410 n=1 Tax=Juglans microcarpa x Juglans regia TaxID=2249226 RepID=UPI001B7DA0A4|nr:uncharacterized protein LOC121253410 [Juglans microcarpa x Juglans regia]
MGLQKLWKDLWNLKLPTKIKIFAWKACKESLPTKHNLVQRKYGDLVGYISGLQQKDQLEVFFLISWSYWHRRNLATFEEKCIHIDQTIAHALAVQHVYKATHGQPLKNVRHHCRWGFPPLGVFKLNVDGAIFQNQHSAGIGVVLRDCKGEVLMAASKKEPAIRDATSIERLAIFRGLQLTAHLGIKHLIIESDALTLVQELQKPEPSMTLVGNVIKDTKELMNCFQVCEVRFAMRTYNEVEHKFAWHVSDISLWWGSFPDVIAPALWAKRQL